MLPEAARGRGGRTLSPGGAPACGCRGVEEGTSPREAPLGVRGAPWAAVRVPGCGRGSWAAGWPWLGGERGLWEAAVAGSRELME